MKAVFGKTVSGISSITRGTYNILTFSRLRSSQSVVNSETDEVEDRELNSLNGAVSTHDHGRSMIASYSPPTQLLHITQEDDILYRKNNVYLKCQIGTRGKSEASSASLDESSSSSTSSPAVQSLRILQGSPSPKPPVEQKVPGFLFIASRGSNYGSTLILNWAPNSTMIKCSGSINSTTCTEGESSDNELTSSSGESERSLTDGAAVPHSASGYSLSPSPPTPRTEHKCVSIDLGEMEVIRVFYHTDKSGCIVSGEMVVSSKQTNFWVFHFQNGGLTDLIHLFCSWKYFSHQQHRESHQHTFSVFRPKLSLSELHPNEGDVRSVLTEDMWQSLFGPDGRITESRCVKKVVFFKGVSPLLRKEVWPFLLGLYEFDSTERERETDRLERCKRYWAVDDLRRKTESEESKAEGVGETVLHQVDKDVVRTDRSHPYYKGEGNRHVGTLRHILLNYLVHKADISYCQGMTDLLAPLLAALDNEVEAFWCFEKLVEGTAYFKPANDHVSVEKQLEPLRMLIKQLLPWFYSYLDATEGGLTLMFCHRWLLVCLKREFSEEDTLAIWEACWTNYETTSFHLFICIAVMAIYGQRAVEKQMNINELMVFFNTLSLTMPRDLVLTQARGYLHQFTTSPSVHCILGSIMAPSFWKQPRSPKLECGLCQGLNTICESRDFQPHTMEAMC